MISKRELHRSVARHVRHRDSLRDGFSDDGLRSLSAIAAKVNKAEARTTHVGCTTTVVPSPNPVMVMSFASEYAIGRRDMRRQDRVAGIKAAMKAAVGSERFANPLSDEHSAAWGEMYLVGLRSTLASFEGARIALEACLDEAKRRRKNWNRKEAYDSRRAHGCPARMA